MLHKFNIRVNDNVYLKSPDSSDLGRRILRGSIDLIDDLGFECFTFKKLAEHIESTEASIYRYFTNKHNLLVYLVHWYWGWMEYRLIITTTNIEDANERLIRAVKALTESVQEDSDFTQINEVKLNRIVIAESSKIYLNKKVESDNKYGFFKPYKDVVHRVSDIITEIDPDYKYPHMLVSTIIEGAHHQRFFAEHLPGLTDVLDDEDAVVVFSTELVKRSLSISKTKSKRD